MAVGATLVCQRAEATRRISAAEFLTGLYETALAPGELLVAVELPARPERTGLSHLRMKLTERPVVTVTALVTLASGTALAAADIAIAQARLIVGSVASIPFAADTGSLLGAGPADFGARAEACAEAAAAACTPLPDGEASPDYLSHLVRVHARQALGEAFTAAAA
jgi:CO/xanthine dehydrogenase FAD-binding subunit